MSRSIAPRSQWARWLVAAGCALTMVWLLFAVAPTAALAAHRASHHSYLKLRRSSDAPKHETLSNKFGELDCNGYSPIQQSVKLAMLCTDIRGYAGVNNANTWDGRFYDNGVYIGHDEPMITYLSPKAGSGNNVTWNETLGTDPSQSPTDTSPGNDVSDWFELSPAPWLSMAMCDPNSDPQLPCTPESDSNAPACLASQCSPGAYPGSGSAFMEMQFYPPGEPPFVDSSGCDDSHWCAALTIDSLACTQDFTQCNTKCEEPVNFAFIQRNGIPTGPPGPEDATIKSATPNGQTLLMSPGDTVRVHMFDAPVPGRPGQMAFKVVIQDLTTGQSGFMQASAVNGFMTTSILNCDGTRFNFQPEYNTAARNNVVPWAADQVDISTEFETGHWEPCNSLTEPFTFSTGEVGFPGATDKSWNECVGPYENTTGADDTTPETGDSLCYPMGDTHGSLNTDPDTMTGCEDDFFQNGDLDFDGSPYWTEWPTSTTAGLYPGSFVESSPLTAGRQYSQLFFQSDLGLSESTCPGSNYYDGTSKGCAIPPPNAPGKFYPYWTKVVRPTPNGPTCTWEFGNVSSVSGATVNTYGKDAQYGTVQTAAYGYPQFISAIHTNTCT